MSSLWDIQRRTDGHTNGPRRWLLRTPSGKPGAQNVNSPDNRSEDFFCTNWNLKQRKHVWKNVLDTITHVLMGIADVAKFLFWNCNSQSHNHISTHKLKCLLKLWFLRPGLHRDFSMNFLKCSWLIFPQMCQKSSNWNILIQMWSNRSVSQQYARR